MVLMGVAIELASNDMFEALDNEVVSLAPRLGTPQMGGRNVASYVDRLVELFTRQQFLLEPLELLGRVGRVGEEVEVGEVTGLGVEHDHFQLAGQGVGVVAFGFEQLVALEV